MNMPKSLVCALALVAPLAKAQLVEVHWDAAGRFEHKTSIPVGKFLEVCGSLKPGLKVDWKFVGSAPTNFNIHYHEGKEVRFPAKEDGVRQSDGTLSVAAAQDYCWMWSNKGPGDMTVAIELRKQ